ncbi:MAG TPA: glutamyl-tRNA reductase [Candidatus Eremiobacteraceae bacterium]|nr:glutamyl-tRNA reductase [Candidatus Eremiobacteraceae bacterium]
MPIVVLGLSHKTAPPEVRDRHAFPAQRVTEALGALRDYSGVREAAIVATCNRLEIYAEVADFETGVGEIKDFLTTYRAMRVEDFDKYLYTLLGADAVAQLLRVASGLDSMLIGEAEIMAQVKGALAAAQAAGTMGSHLNRLFRTALRAGKRARTETTIGSDVVSLGAATVELASRRVDLRGASAVVVGAGKMGTTVARHLAARGAGRIAIVNRTLARAQTIASEIGARALPFDALCEALADADLAVTAVGSGAHLVTTADIATAMTTRPGRPLLIVDIGAPHDVDPGARSIGGVDVLELADLRVVVDEHIGGRKAAVPAVEAIVDELSREFLRWYQSRAAVPLIARLRTRAERIRTNEIERLFASRPELDEAQRAAIVQASIGIINKLLHEPLTKLRETAASATQAGDPADALNKLVDLASMEEQIERRFSTTFAPPAR